MTVGDYLDHLLKIGMGWLGWTEQQTLDTSMPAIVIAYDGRLELLQSIFGSGKPPEEAQADAPPADRAEVANKLKSVFRALQAETTHDGMGR